MSKVTKKYVKIPWDGGVNTSVDPGMLNDNDLVIADNVIFSSSGSRLKREGRDYFDSSIPTPSSRSSSGTTRTLYFTGASPLQATTPATDKKLVNGERITVTTSLTSGDEPSYAATDTPITALTAIAEVTDIQCVADVSGSLNDTYFDLPAGENGVTYYVWFNVNSAGTDPAITGKTGVEVALATNDGANTVASAVQTAIDALSDFSASVTTDTVTATAATAGPATDASDTGSCGFTITVTTQGGHSITYEATGTLSESSTSTTTLTIAKASSIINLRDYWRFTGAVAKSQLLMSATDDFKLYKFDTSGRRDEVAGQEQVQTIQCIQASSMTTGDYWNLWDAGDSTAYYVWYNIASGGGDPAIGGKTGVEVAVGGSDTADQVASATQAAIDALSGMSASVSTDTVTVTNDTAGITTTAADVDAGVTVAVTSYGATLPESAVDKMDSRVLNERFILAFSGLGDKPIMYRPEGDSKYQLLGGTPPDFAIMAEFLGRVWTNDKTNPDRIHYSSTQNPEEWQGIGDSGSLDISTGDNDPGGVTGIFPFKGILFIQKQKRLFRVVGNTPETFKIEPVSSGIGGESHTATVPVDQDDVMYISKRGFHSVAATDTYGDTEAAFLSKKIQPTFNNWNQARLDNIQGAYVPELNSVAFAVSENSSANDTVWLFNVILKAWYRWPEVSCQALSTRLANNETKFIFGTNAGRIMQAQNGGYTDYETSGISYRVKTGTIYPGGDIDSVKAFKKLGLMYKAKGNFVFTVNVRIDNYPVQSLLFQQEASGDKLDVDFILGQSVLGTSSVLAPYTQQIDGYGRGLTLEILQSGTAEQVEIYGFILEYEDAGDAQETIGSQSEEAAS